MRRSSRPMRLVPVGDHLAGQRAELRLRAAWKLIVGPALADRTRLLRVERDILVMGCWELAHIGALREATAAVWPQMRLRIQRSLGLEMRGLQVVPCDAPVAAPEPVADEDPLRRAMRLLALRHEERVALGLERR
ncbi:MAG: DciA family protein [Holophagaceae bacterium]